MIYLDSAATTLEKPDSVARAVAAAMRSCASPGRGGYQAAKRADSILFRCRERAAELFDVSDPEHVVLTFNATHGLNIAIRTLVKPGSRVVISGYEHNAVTRTLHDVPDIRIQIARSALFEPMQALESFRREINEGVDVVICNHVSNVFGYIQPIEEIALLCREKGVPLIIDASQSAGAISLSMLKLDAAFIVMPGHKGLYGPQGTGLLLCGDKANPILCGGTGSASRNQAMPEFLPDRLEAGTQNVCGTAGLLAGMEFVLRTGVQNIGRHERGLCGYTAEQLKGLTGIRVFSGEQQSGVISFASDQIDCESFGERLANSGIAVRAGLHCAPLAHETAGTLETGTVRLSFSAFSTKRQAEQAAQAIRNILA